MTAIQHIAMNCHDRLAQERFYTEQLGFRRCRVFNADTPGEFVMCRLGSLCLEFFDNPGADPATAGGEQPVGFKHMAFEVEDLDGAVASMRAAGREPGDIIDCSEIVPGMRVCFLTDPEGNIIELMEGWQDQEGIPG